MRLVSILIVYCFCWPIPVWAAEDPDYFPLQVGNWWEYEWEYHIWDDPVPPERALLRTEVGSVTQIGGRAYFQLLHHFGWGVGDTLWVRAEEQRVWSWVPEQGELLWLDFGRSEGDVWYIHPWALGWWYPSDTAPGKWKVPVANTARVDSVFVESDWTTYHRPYLQQILPGWLGQVEQLKVLMFLTVRGIKEWPNWGEYYVAGVGPVFMSYGVGFAEWGQVILRRAQVGAEMWDFSTSLTPRSWGEVKRRWLKR